MLKIKNNNRLYWNILIIFPLCLSVIFFIKFLVNMNYYHRLDHKTDGQITSWRIDQYQKGRFVVMADYEYKINEKQFSGKKVFDQKKFYNYHAALGYLNKLSNKNWNFWYNSKDFLFSDVEKRLFLKNFIYFGVSFFVFLYFIFLRKKINKINT